MAAEVAESTPTPQPAGAPGGGGTQGTGAPPGGGGTSAQPTGAPSSGEPAEKGGAPPEGAGADARGQPVPYATFRRERSNFRREIKNLEARIAAAGEWERKFGTLDQEHKTLQERFQDYNALAAVIRANPELAEQVSEAIRQGGGQAPRGTERYAELPPQVVETLNGMGKLVKQVEQASQQQARQEQQRALDDTRKEVQTRIGKLLQAKGLDEKFLPSAEAYVLRRVNELGDEAEMDDIPYLFAEWAGPLLDWHNSKLSALAAGKKADSGLPAPPGSSPPVNAAAAKHGLDGEATKRGVDFLLQRGWAP